MKCLHRSLSAVAFAAILSANLAHGQTEPSTAQMLASLTADYAKDPLLETVTFGIKVDDEWWTVSTNVATSKAMGVADFMAGRPPGPTFYFAVDSFTLRKLYRRELSVLTAMAKTPSTIPASMQHRFMDGFEPDEDSAATMFSVAFHFWTRGQPEKIPFGGEYTRTMLGAQLAMLYSEPGFRSAYLQIRPGQHVNMDPAKQVNEFKIIFIVIDGGTAMARIGDKEMPLRGREAILIPAGVRHEFWNEGDIPAEGILLILGDKP